jgi:hypothetical protein
VIQYRYYALIVLLIGGTNIGDRMILSIMLEPIGREFRATDTELWCRARVRRRVRHRIISADFQIWCADAKQLNRSDVYRVTQ